MHKRTGSLSRSSYQRRRISVRGSWIAGILSVGLISQSSATCVPVFDGTLYSGKPDLASQGFKPIITINPFYWWQKGESKNQLTTGDGPARWVEANSGSKAGMIVLDIETWPTTGDADAVANTVKKLNGLADKLKAAGINKPFGYYSILPARDYWRATSNTDSARFKAWQADNDATKSVALHVDALFPSLYTFYDDPSGWKTYAIANLKEARRISAGRPVYAYLWPVYHDSSKQLHGKPIPSDFWQQQLETVAANADGIVIWGGYTQSWNPDAEWWKVTSQFIQDHRCVEQSESSARSQSLLRNGRDRQDPSWRTNNGTPIR